MKEIALEFLTSSGKFEIKDRWQIDVTDNQRRECFQIVTSTDRKSAGILNDFILSDFELFRIWLRNLRSDVTVEEFDLFINERYPEILL
ncbi:hypothetical protein EHQ75_15995 [Leptospira levettii]|uniref:hypothetical protein n=1 Tax=Leptospira levettii TaxID=2023178 RepID=UPI001082C097|nr:hypothetical protein [Leptospira levettii]TGM35690.1 hypothetical protein EHQ75_15995 [Leptospira levettii]